MTAVSVVSLSKPYDQINKLCISIYFRPVTHNVGDFLNMLRVEDPGIDRAVIRTTEGVRIASTTSIQVKIDLFIGQIIL